MRRGVKLILGCLLISLSILIFKHAHITTGGTTGLALNLSYILSVPFDYVFFMVNLPFYILSIRGMGWNFTVATVFSVGIVSCFTGIERFLPALVISPWGGALLGGCLMGIGLAILFSGRSSIAGTGVVTVYLQKRFGWNPGRLNLLFDSVIIGIGTFAVSLTDTLFSALSIVIISLILSFFKNRIANTYTAEPAVVSVSVNN